MRNGSALVGILMLFLTLFSGQAQAISCAHVHAPLTFEASMKLLVDQNLYLLQEHTSQIKTDKEIHAENRRLILKAESLPIHPESKRVTESQIDLAVRKIENHKVAGNYEKYDREDALVGYCFGQAACGHLQSLRAGIKKAQIKKVWAVGPMRTNGADWSFHVALAIRDHKGKWWVADPYFGEAKDLSAWYTGIRRISTDKKMQIFLTEPEKFGPYAGKYSRDDLGLDVDRQMDYYNGFFKDLMESFGEK